MLFMRTSDGLDLQYRETGRGPTIVFSHEFGGSYASWEKQVERLSMTHRCIVYTARGFSPSTISSEEIHYGRQLLVRDLVELAEHLRLERFHLVGAAIGAVTTLLAAEQLGGKVKTITLVDCPAGPLAPMDLFEHRSRIRKMLLALEKGELAMVGAALCKQRPYEGLHGDSAPWRHKYRNTFEQHSSIGLALTLRLVEWDVPDFGDLQSRLKHIEAPILLIAGNKDHPTVKRADALLTDVLALTKIVKLSHCCGLLHLEQPVVFNKLLWQHVRNAELRESGQRHYSKLELTFNIDRT